MHYIISYHAISYHIDPHTYKYIYNYIERFFFFRGQEFIRSFFRLGLSIGFSELEFLNQIASVVRRLRGEAPTPLALPSPFCT